MADAAHVRRPAAPAPARQIVARPVAAAAAASARARPARRHRSRVGGHLAGIMPADVRATGRLRARLADEFAPPARQRDVGQRLHVAARARPVDRPAAAGRGSVAIPAQRARLAGLVVEDGVAATLERVDAIDTHLERAAGDVDLAPRFELVDLEGRARALALRAGSRSAARVAMRSRSTAGAAPAARSRDRRTTTARATDWRSSAGAPARRWPRASEMQPSSLLHTSSSALCSSMPRSRASMPGAGSSRRSRAEPHFAVGMKAAFRLQRERLDAAAHRQAVCRRRRPARLRASRAAARAAARPAARIAAPARRLNPRPAATREQQWTRRAMRIAFEARPGAHQRAGGARATRRARRAPRALCPAALAAGMPAATCSRSGMKTSGRGGGGHCAASRPATQMPS